MAEVRKLGANDLQIGEGTVVSPGGKTVQEIDARHIPVAYGTANDAVTDYSNIVFSVEDALKIGVNVKAYGVTGNGTTDDAAAIQAAIDALPTTGGTLFFNSGIYLCASGLNLDDKRSIILRGTSGMTSGAKPSSYLIFSGTGSGRLLSFRSTSGCAIEDLGIYHTSSSFTGKLIDLSHSAVASDTAFFKLSRCFVGGDGFTGTAIGINLDQSLESTIDNCHFSYLLRGIDGQDPGGGSYSNVVRIRDNQFTNIVSNAIAWGGEAWLIEGNTFEPLSNGTAGAFGNDTSTQCKGISFINNWCGDVTTGGGTWFGVWGEGVNFTGNRIGGNSTSNAISLNTVNGYSIVGNSFDTFSVAIDYTTATCTNGYVQGNRFTSVTNQFGTTTNQNDFLQATDGYVTLPSNIIYQWGDETVYSSATKAVTFPKAFTSAVYTITTGNINPSESGSYFVLTSPTITGFNAVLVSATNAGLNWMAIGK